MQIFTKYQDTYSQACTDFVNERRRFRAGLEQVPFLRLIPSSANYFLCEVSGRYSAKDLCSRLLFSHNILVKDCTRKTGFEKGEYIRIAVRNEADNDNLIDVLQKLSC
jgi:histidinol-phosphate/aromatic aminotransferase/cobyric acid decarboxylase-like protein